MDEECRGPSKEMRLISATANSCFLCGHVTQTSSVKRSVCVNASDNGSVTLSVTEISCNDGSSVILICNPTQLLTIIMCFYLGYKAG